MTEVATYIPATAVEAAQRLLERLPQEVSIALRAWALEQAPTEAERRLKRAQTHRQALALRDAMLRTLNERYHFQLAPTAASETIATALRRYAASGWRLDARPLDGERALLHKILVSNDGRTLGARQVRNILVGARTPETCP